MAGQFESVIGITGFDAFADAVQRVLDSRERSGAAGTPIAVLVQPLIDPLHGGVMFGIDPVSGRTDRRVVSAVDGGPERLVSGEVDGSRYVLDPRGRALEFAAGDGPTLTHAQLRRLVALSSAVAQVFGGPQDVEWAIEHDGRVLLLQSRPVTTEVRGVPVGPVYGPGPVAETFPEPLAELEHDLWVPPLRDAVREAVLLAGSASPADVDRSRVVVNVSGHVAIDLRLAGVIRTKPSIWQRLNPVPAMRRLHRRVAGRPVAGRAARPRRAAARPRRRRPRGGAAARRAVEPPAGRAVPPRARGAPVTARPRDPHGGAHRRERQPDDGGVDRAAGARRGAARRVSPTRRCSSAARWCIALTPPRVAPRPELPPDSFAVDLGADGDSDNDNGILREALRLRVRWVQELTGRAAWELGVRLTAAGELVEPEMIRHMTLDHVEAVFTKRAVVVPELVLTHLAQLRRSRCP